MRYGCVRDGFLVLIVCSLALGLLAAGSSPVAAETKAATKTAPKAAPKKASNAMKMRFATFQTSPFPFDGEIPEKGGVRFLDAVEGDRKGHTSRAGNVYWQDKTYADRRVLLALPRGFDPSKPVLLVVFFHGNGAKLERDVHLRQQVTRQVLESGRNTVLIAPQFAVDALDSSAGRFWEPGVFRAFLDEAAAELAQMSGHEALKPVFDKAPVVMVAYSGGYLPAAFSLQVGDVDDRVQGLVMLDALYGEVDKFRAWMARKPDMYFVSVHTEFTAPVNQALQKQMRDDNLKYTTSLPRKIEPGTIAFISVPPKKLPDDAEQKDKDKAAGDLHKDFVNKAFADDPLRLILARVPRPAAVAATPVAAATTTDPHYVARMPRPRPKPVMPAAQPASEPAPAAPRPPTARAD